MMTALLYVGAALAEIAGCYAVWLWWREDRSILWLVPGIVLLALFAWLLARVPTVAAGQAYAAYGGIYIAMSLAWLWGVERQAPSLTDLVGAALAIAGAVVIIAGALRSAG